MKPVKSLIVFLLTAGFIIPAYGQPRPRKAIISGYVTDRNYYPVVGACILIDNRDSGVTTDERGLYKVRVEPNAKTLGVNSLIFGIIKESIDQRFRIDFTFPSTISGGGIPRDSFGSLYDNEEINIGYGTKKRRELTTSVSKIDRRNKRFDIYNSIYDLLDGSVPGVDVNRNHIVVRGYTPGRGNVEPLYIVDGTPVSSIENISPRMVKSIEVLKGPACAIYGARGANGVILIDLLDGSSAEIPLPSESGRVPFVVTQSATNIEAKTATLNGLINANDHEAFITFEYGTAPWYGKKVSLTQKPGSGNTPFNVSAVVSDLEYNTRYHYRVVATNSVGSTVGVDMTFTTLGKVPATATKPATNITPGTARFNGSVNPGNLSTIVSFEYGTDSVYGSSIKAVPSPVTGNVQVDVYADIIGLTTGKTYHYRVAATNDAGTVYGSDKTFRANYELGEFIYGGIIFYLDQTGEHGLICAPTDQSLAALWGNCTPAGATGKEIGTGKGNTLDIVNGCPGMETAARLCYDLEINGYNDWFLPSINELALIFNNLHQKGLGGFKDTFYWSSTQDKYGAWVMSFRYGSKSNHRRDEKAIFTRAIRAF